MRQYVVDIFRGNPGQSDSRQLEAQNDAEAVAEAEALFTIGARGDPSIRRYRLRNPSRGSDRIFHEGTAPADERL
jgi:hypothetical protein